MTLMAINLYFFGFVVFAVFFLAFVLLTRSVKVLRQYERAVTFKLGKFQSVKGPGLVLLMPFVQQIVRVDMRIQVVENYVPVRAAVLA